MIRMTSDTLTTTPPPGDAPYGGSTEAQKRGPPVRLIGRGPCEIDCNHLSVAGQGDTGIPACLTRRDVAHLVPGQDRCMV